MKEPLSPSQRVALAKLRNMQKNIEEKDREIKLALEQIDKKVKALISREIRTDLLILMAAGCVAASMISLAFIKG